MQDFFPYFKQSACLLLLAGIKNILTETHSKDKKKMLNPVTPLHIFILGTLNLYVVL